MTLKITAECINCDVCEPVCPNQAIYPGDSIYHIDKDLCTECIGHHDTPQCQTICPVSCIEKDHDYPETPKQLLEKYNSLVTGNCNNK